MIGRILRFLFGDGRNAIVETGELFRPNAEKAAERAARLRAAALGELAAEQARQGCGRFDRVVDALNRLPRPALAFGTIALFVLAMLAPEAFARRMAGLALVPEPLWWLFGAIISFYFGARELHYRRLRKDMHGFIGDREVKLPPRPARNGPLGSKGASGNGQATSAIEPDDDNPALARWQARRRENVQVLDENRP